ncbi:MAG: DMT family transporter [Gemmobacter sp.]|nr:DMT family transporter [Gemmobacter sp.]
MARRASMDMAGAASLVALSVLFGFNQVTIKIVNTGFNPVLAAGLRSALALVCVLAWMRWRGLGLRPAPGTVRLGATLGAVFAVEFLCIYLSLDFTTVTRATVILYSMPVWLALAAHWFIPGERITARKALGLVLAFGGMAGAMFDRGSLPPGAESTLPGDLLALGGALGWAAVALVARQAGTRGMGPEQQLLWMVTVSAVLLLAVAPAFGPALREVTVLSVASLVFQGAIVVAVGFVAWFWLLATYPPSGVASFSFLSPVLALFLGWLLLDEPVSPGLLAAGTLVAVGLVVINWPGRASA